MKRKNLLATLSTILVFAFVLGIFGMGPETSAAAESTLVPGTYTSTQRGYQGEVTVEVEVDETSILSVTIVSDTDRPETVTAVPREQIPAAIVENQTYNVDSVSGATLTSSAIKRAVKDALEQAGGSSAFSETVSAKIPSEEKPFVEDEQVDVLVIGAGGAGIMAALSANSQALDENASGLSVMLIEKQPFIGGATGVSGGIFYQYQENPTEAAAMETDIDQAYNSLPVRTDILENQMVYNADTVKKLTALGLTIGEDWLGFMPYFAGHEDEHDHDHWFGWNLTSYMTDYIPTTGVDLRTNTKALSLLTDEGGAVIGASVEGPESKYNVYAKKVVLATGGFAQNRDLIAEYAPDYVGTLAFSPARSTGDGLKMAVDIGAATVGNSMLGYLGSDMIEGMWDDFSEVFHYGGGTSLNVNKEAQRYADESESNNVEYKHVIEQTDHWTYGIVDSDNAGVDALINSDSSHVYKADSIAELAELLKLDAETLQATIDKYNADYDAGEDTQFGTPADFMDRVDAAPYYAFDIRPVALSSLVGLDVTENLEVRDTEGNIIENLYAAGDMMLGGNFIEYYIGCRGVGTAIHSGRLAGENAKNALLG